MVDSPGARDVSVQVNNPDLLPVIEETVRVTLPVFFSAEVV